MAELDGLIEAWTRTLPTDALLDELDRHGVPAGRIYTAPDMLDDDHYASRNMVERIERRDGTSVPAAGIVPKFLGTPGVVRHGGPALGEHTRSVLRDVARYDDVEIDELAAAGVIATDDDLVR